MALKDLSIKFEEGTDCVRAHFTYVRDFITYTGAMDIPATWNDVRAGSLLEYLEFAKATLWRGDDAVILEIPAKFLPAKSVRLEALPQTELQKMQAEMHPIIEELKREIAELRIANAKRQRYVLEFDGSVFSSNYPDPLKLLLKDLKERLMDCCDFLAKSSNAVRVAIRDANSFVDALNIAGISQHWLDVDVLDMLAENGLVFVENLCEFRRDHPANGIKSFYVTFTVGDVCGNRVASPSIKQLSEATVVSLKGLADDGSLVHFIYE